MEGQAAGAALSMLAALLAFAIAIAQDVHCSPMEDLSSWQIQKY